MIRFDVTKAGSARQRSGLTRVSRRLRAELGPAATEVTWGRWDGRAAADDWFLTPELFSAEERPGFAEFLASPPCRTAAIYHDSIPLRFPQFTWPHSVARHPGYLTLLARFHRIWAVSEASREELLGFWRWQGVKRPPPVDVLPLGADLPDQPRVTGPATAPAAPDLLCVGILEPRKNQALLLEVADRLWSAGLSFNLHVVGRLNPHFGEPIRTRIRQLRAAGRPVHLHLDAGDAELRARYASARACVFPTRAEGCGLPLLESLWCGVPVVASDLPPLRETAAGGGCALVPPDDAGAWAQALRRILTDDEWQATLTREARTRDLPTWAAAAARLRADLG